jgi:DNA-binding NarL/FixJ family response regulator
MALEIQEATVRFHVKNIVKKLRAKNSTDENLVNISIVTRNP